MDAVAAIVAEAEAATADFEVARTTVPLMHNSPAALIAVINAPIRRLEQVYFLD